MSLKQTLFANREYQEIFKELYDLTIEKETSQPFIPIISDEWGQGSKPKIFWYGAAPYEWDHDKKPKSFNFAKVIKENDNWVAEKFHKRNSRSLFWKLQLDFLNLYDCDYNQAIWGNLYRIGGPREIKNCNPSAKLQKIQHELCIKAFEIELQILQPDLIVLHTGELANHLFYDLTRSWKQWDLYDLNGKAVAAYTTKNSIPVLWFSRGRSFYTQNNKSGILDWCRQKLATVPKFDFSDQCNTTI